LKKLNKRKHAPKSRLGRAFLFRLLVERKMDNSSKNAENSDMLCKNGGIYGRNQALRRKNR
jgi:hypothetical protein